MSNMAELDSIESGKSLSLGGSSSLATSEAQIIRKGFEDDYPPYSPAADIPLTYETPAFLLSFQRFRDKWGLRPLFVEFFGSFLFVFMVTISAVGFAMTGGEFGSFLTIIMTVSSSVVFAAYIAGPISGGFLNPTVTIVMALFRGFPWKRVPGYLIAQFLGSFVAGIIVYGIAAPYFTHADGGNRMIIPIGPSSTVAAIIPTPASYIPNGSLVLNEFIADCIFMFILAGLTDPRNSFVNHKSLPAYVGLAVFMICAGHGWNLYVLNPFRDFGPRVYLSHYYDGLFTYHNHFAMVPLFTPFLGTIGGALLYDFMVAGRYKKE